MNYGNSSTGFRIAASVGIIILMLGVAIAISISANSTMNDQIDIMTNFNIPLEKTIIRMDDLQKEQGLVMSNYLRLSNFGDSASLQASESEFYSNSNLITNEITRAKDIVTMGYANLPQSYINPPPDAILSKLSKIESLNSEYSQLAAAVFSAPQRTGVKELALFSDSLDTRQKMLQTEQESLLNEMNLANQNINVTVDENKQKFLTLEIVIITAVGIISLTSSHFVNQINKDLVQEVIKKTRSLQKANDKLRKMSLLKDEFISEASHELKSPLSPIYGFAELAKCGDIGKEEALSGIVKQARQIEEVANKILDVAKIENNMLHLHTEEYNLTDSVTEISEYSRSHLSKGVSLELELEANVIVEADRIRVAQVIRNLLNNAIKFTSSGKITIRLRSVDGLAEVSVSDSGAGIHPDILPDLFGKFVTKSHGKENLGGSGLGLYISKRIVEAHNGTILGFNNPDHGATVIFSIPMIHAESRVLKREVLN